MPEPVKAKCPQCPRTDVSVVGGGVLRAHAANSKKITPENPACPGSGGSPADAYAGEPGDEHHEGRVKCKVCRYPYPLTSNGRIRTHLDRGAPNADGTQPNCPGGSDWPLGVEGIGDDVLSDTVDPVTGSYRETHYVEGDLHLGSQEDCVQGTCVHAHQYEYGDDDNGHSGSFCGICGKEEPDDRKPVLHPPATGNAADDFLGGTAEPEPEGDGKGNWFESRYDGDCSTCFTSFYAGDRIRADGEGGWEAEDCCGDEVGTSAQAAQGQAQERAKHVAVSLQLPVKNGRYVAPHPETGKQSRFTRSTNFASSISDSFTLDQWKARMLALGLARRPDLMEKVKKILSGGVPYEIARERRDDLNAIAEEAKLAAGSKERAKKGTQLHKHTEEVESGRKGVADVPEEYRRDVVVYLAALEQAGFRPVKHLIERSVLSLELGVVGTFDRVLECVRDQPVVTLNGRKVQITKGDFVIGDVKSGERLHYAWQEILIQLSTYAHGFNENGVADVDRSGGKPVWTWADPASLGVPRVREDVGIVMHAPYGEHRCDILPADLAEGWKDAQLCTRVITSRDPKMPEALVSWHETDVPGAAFVKELARAVGDPGTVMNNGFDRPTAAQMATDHPSVASGHPFLRDTNLQGDSWPTWDDRFRAVTSKEEASRCWKDAKAAGVPDKELKRLVALAQEALKPSESVSRPNPSAPVPAATETPEAAPAPVRPPSPPTLEERAAAVTTRAEASVIFQEMKTQVAEIGMDRLNRVVKIMQDALAERV